MNMSPLQKILLFAFPLILTCLQHTQCIQVSKDEESFLMELCNAHPKESSFRRSIVDFITPYKIPENPKGSEDLLGILEMATAAAPNSVLSFIPKVDLTDFNYSNFTQLSPKTCAFCDNKAKVFIEECKTQMCPRCSRNNYEDIYYCTPCHNVHRFPYDLELFSLDESALPHMAVLQKPKNSAYEQEALAHFQSSLIVLGNELVSMKDKISHKAYDPVKQQFKQVLHQFLYILNTDIMKLHRPLFFLDRWVKSMISAFRAMVSLMEDIPKEYKMTLSPMTVEAFLKSIDFIYYVRMFSVRVERAVLYKQIPNCKLQSDFQKLELMSFMRSIE